LCKQLPDHLPEWRRPVGSECLGQPLADDFGWRGLRNLVKVVGVAGRSRDCGAQVLLKQSPKIDCH